MEKKTQKTINSFIINEIRNTGFEQEVNSLPVGDESSPKTLLWFSMTSINKLGVNPQSHWDTPIGIYCYPLTSDYKTKLFMGRLPFAGDQPYIQVFGVKPSTKMLELAKYTQENYQEDLEKLRVSFGSMFIDYKQKKPDNKTIVIIALNNLTPVWEKTLEVKVMVIFLKIFLMKNFSDGNVQSYSEKKQLIDILSLGLVEFFTRRNIENIEGHLNNFLTFYKTETIAPGKLLDSEELKKVASVVVNKFSQEFAKIANEVDKETFSDPFDMFIKQCEVEARVKTPAGYIWNVTRLVASKVQSNKFDENNPGGARAAVTWTTILKTVLGYDCVYDNGQGIIHENEPTQMVVFNFKVIDFKQTIINRHSKHDVTMSDYGIQDKTYQKDPAEKNKTFEHFLKNFKDDFIFNFPGTPFTARNVLERLDQLAPSFMLLVFLSLFPHNITEEETNSFNEVVGPINAPEFLRIITGLSGNTSKNYVRHYRELIEQQLLNKIMIKNHQVLYTYSDVLNLITDKNLRQFVANKVTSLLPTFLPVYQTIDQAVEAAEQTKQERQISWFLATQSWKHAVENPQVSSPEQLGKFTSNLTSQVINHIATNILKYQHYPTVMSWLNKQDLSYKQ